MHLRLGHVEPPDFDTVPIVVLSHLLPDELPRFGMCRIEEVQADRPLGSIINEAHLHREATLGANQQPTLLHLLEVGAKGVDRGPDGDHQLDPHLLQLAHHRRRIGPALGVELPIALERPVEEINDDDGER